MRKGNKQTPEAIIRIAAGQAGKKRGPYRGSFRSMLSQIPEDEVRKIIEESFSFREVFVKLKLNLSGSSNPALKIYAIEHGYTLDHFLGQSANSGARYKGNRKTADEILILRPIGTKIGTTNFKDRLIEIGRKYECELCHLGSEWMGKTIRLEVDHIDGQRNDDRPENLRFLCPNCHSQTSTFRNKKRI